ncbi:transposase, partial [Salinimicrobium oceani]
SDEFKRQIVNDYESGRYSVFQLSKLHGMSRSMIYNWIHKFSTFNEKGYRVVEMKDSSSKKMQELEAKNKELEAALGRKQIQLDYLEKMIELAKSELDIDIKKNYSTPQSTGSGKTKKK